MKFTILINQKQVVEAGLADKTDLIDWSIIDYIQKFQTSTKAKRLGSKVWINLTHLMNEMPLLGLNSKQAVSKRISKLKELGLLYIQYDDESKLYCEITDKCFAVVESDGEGSTTVDGDQPQLTGGSTTVDIEHTSNKQTSNNKTPSKKYSDEHLDFAENCLSEIKEIYPSTNSKVETWAETVRKLVELDEKTLDEIKTAWIWARGDPFWKKNCKALTKLRERNGDGIYYIEIFLEAKKIDELRQKQNAPRVRQTAADRAIETFKQELGNSAVI